MDIVILIGRILFAAIFAGGALGHFTNTATMSQYCESSGLRPGRVYVLGSGIWMLAAIILIVLGAWADLGALMLVVFLIPTAVFMHAFWRHSDIEMRMNEQIQFSKDISLAGAALFLFGFVVKTGDSLGLTLTGPLFS
ncbi:DoxX family protein [Gordonia terrae]